MSDYFTENKKFFYYFLGINFYKYLTFLKSCWLGKTQFLLIYWTKTK